MLRYLVMGAAAVRVQCEDRDLPHILHRAYDTSWHPSTPTSLHALRAEIAGDEWAGVIVAAVDDAPLADGKTGCDDLDERCAGWAAVGECENNPKFVRPRCAESCGTCEAARGGPCGGGAAALESARVALRAAQRQRPSRFLRIAVATRSAWEGPWLFPGDPGTACGAIVLEPRDDWAGAHARGFPEGSSRIAHFGAATAARREFEALARASSRTVEEYTFANDLDYEVTLHWFDLSQEEGLDKTKSPYVDVGRVSPGKSATIGTSIGHVFLIKGPRGFVAFATARGRGDAVRIDADLLAASETCDARRPHDPHAVAARETEMARLAGLGAAGASDRIEFAATERVRDLAFEKRKALSDVQIAVVENVTAVGFELVRCPEEVYRRVTDFYASNHARRKVEEGDGGPLYNQRQVRTWHTPLPNGLRRYVFDELKHVMERWAPTTAPLQGTSAYGVRTYERGSYLHLHVDTAQTHVVSGILNVDQRADADWPLEILDHDGKLHAVNMKPGDLLLYESAKLLHGRPTPFDGDFYANIFVHYMPKSGWKPDT